MRNEVIISPEAHQDTREQAGHIGDDNPDAAMRFTYAVKEAYDLLAKHPEIAVVRDFGRPELAGLRMWPIPGFEKHLIFYRAIDHGIEVIRVLHGSRDIESILLGNS